MEDQLKQYASSKVLLIGDVILDEYRYGSALGLSAETPTIVVRDETTTVSLGGAGLFCRNMLSLGGQVKFVSLMGDDEFRQPADNYHHESLTKQFYDEPGRKTTVKSRFWAGGYKLLSWDRLDNRFIGPELEERIASQIKTDLPQFDKLIVSDYRHGLISESLAGKLVQIAKECGKPLYVDSQVSQQKGNHRWYKGATLFCLNRREALTVDAEFDSRPIEESLAVLQDLLSAEIMIVKLGEKGCVTRSGSKILTAAPPETQVKDTTGAGDAFFSVISLAGDELSQEDLQMANNWAALSTTLQGAQPPTLEMFREAYSASK